MSAPDCIQPLFQGDDIRQLRRAVRAKIAFVRETGGLYVGIVHGGVFGDRDARPARGAPGVRVPPARAPRRVARHRRRRRRTGGWRASIVAHQRASAIAIVVTNQGRLPVAGARVLVERDAGTTVLPVPLLEPGESVTLARLDEGLPAVECRVQAAS